MKRLLPRHIMVLAALCCALAGGVGLTTNIAGLFFDPIAADFGTGRGAVSLTLTICNIIYAVGGILMPRFVRPANYKRMMALGMAATAVSTLLLNLSTAIWQMYLLNAVRGFATGFCGTVMATIVVNNWFRRNNGLFTSIVMGCSGLSGALFSPLFSTLIGHMGWRFAYGVSAAAIAVLYLPVILLPIGLTPESVGQQPYGHSAEEENDRPLSPGKVPFRLFCVVSIFATMGGLLAAVVQHFPGIARTHALSAAAGPAMLSAGLVANTAGKLILGSLIDRFGIRRSVLGVTGAVALGVALVGWVRSDAAAVVGAFLIGLSYSTVTVGLVMMTRQVFGLANYSAVYPKVSMFTTVFYALGASLIGMVYDSMKSYSLVFAALLVFAAVLAACNIIAAKSRIAPACRQRTDGFSQP